MRVPLASASAMRRRATRTPPGSGSRSSPPKSGSRVETSGAIRVDDVGEVIANPPDTSIEGTTFRVAGVHDQTHSTSRRLPVEVHSHG